MARKLGTFLALTVLVVSSAPASGAPSLVARQAPEETPAGVAPLQLDLGAMYTGFGFELGASSFLTEASPTAVGVTEVRVGVVYRNTSAGGVPAWTPGIDRIGYPTFAVRDGDGDLHSIDLLRPDKGVLSGTTTIEIGMGAAARWTLGFQVPTKAADDLSLVALEAGTPVAEWPLSGVGPAIAIGAPELEAAALGTSIEWQPGVEVVARATGTLVCGNTSVESVAHLFTVTFDVHNDTKREVRWPGDLQRGLLPALQWADGTLAAMDLETFWGDVETFPRVSANGIRMPALTSATRAMVFAAPRDGRFTDISDLPTGVRLPTATGEVWLDLGGVEPTIGLDPALCDLGGLGAPVPYAFGPGPTFEVGGEGPVADRARQDDAARNLLTTSRSGASQYLDANNLTLAHFDEDAFLGAVPNVDISEIRAGTDTPIGRVGEVYFDRDPNRPRFLFLVTRSGSGTWFCSSGDLFTQPTRVSQPSFNEAGLACYPEVFLTLDDA